MEPTGKDGEARVGFTVPASRGTASTVAIIVDGNVVREYAATGVQDQVVAAGSNGLVPTTRRWVNEFGRCSDTTPQQVQTYGPLTSAKILSVRSEVSGRTGALESLTADANGNPATVHIQKLPRRANHVAGISTQEVATGFVDLGYGQTEVRSPSRSTTTRPRAVVGTATGIAATGFPPAASVAINRGTLCIDPSDGTRPQCQNDVQTDQCNNVSCGFIVVNAVNFPATGASRQLDRRGSPTVPPRATSSTETRETKAFEGSPGSVVDVPFCYVGPLVRRRR